MISGLILIPWVSSSKKRSSPALAAGMGELLSRLFSLRLKGHQPWIPIRLAMLSLINVASPSVKRSARPRKLLSVKDLHGVVVSAECVNSATVELPMLATTDLMYSLLKFYLARHW